MSPGEFWGIMEQANKVNKNQEYKEGWIALSKN